MIPTVTVGLQYTPPAPGTPWQGNTVYPAGSVVTPNPDYPKGDGKTPSSENGHYFTARVGGISTNITAAAPELDPTAFIYDGTVKWIDSGTTQPAAAPSLPGTQTQGATQSTVDNWQSGTTYPAGSVVFYPPLNRYYYAYQGGTSAATPPFSIKQFPDHDNSDLKWTLLGKTPPAGTTAPPTSLAWKSGHTYNTGDLAYDVTTSRYFTVSNGGDSGQVSPLSLDSHFFDISEGPQSTLVWSDLGNVAPSVITPVAKLAVPTWKASTAYRAGDVIFEPATGHYYTAIADGISSPSLATRPVFGANHQAIIFDGPMMITQKPESVVESFKNSSGVEFEGTWKVKPKPTADPPCLLPKGAKAGGAYPYWQAGGQYNNGDCIKDPNTDGIFQLGIPHSDKLYTAGLSRPEFSRPPPQDLPLIQWEDSGTTAPTIVASGQPANQMPSQAYPVPQVHSKYYFNLDSGIVVSSVHSKSFGWQTNSLPSGTTPGSYTPIQTGSSVIVDPVLLLTVYIWPMDAERVWQKKDLRPAIAFGLSLASPASNFYFGLNTEVRRNIQIVGGFTVAQTSSLSSTSTSTVNTSPPPTKQNFTPGGFIGVSYNILGFIQGVFGGK